MNTPTSSFSPYADDEHRVQAEEFMLELGRFTIEFERVCEAMGHTVLCIFHSESLKHQGLSQVVIGGKASAELQVLVGALFSELRARFTDEDRKAVRTLLAAVRDLTEQRNEVLHTAWQLGDAAREVELMAVAIRPTTAQTKGAIPRVHGLSPSYLRTLSQRAKELQVYLSRLQTCVLQQGFVPAVVLRDPA
jgi:hypothetical protein